MDSFERDTEEREKEQKLREILSVWAAFRISLSELMDSYNRGPDGLDRPAQMTKPTDESIVIDCPRGIHPKERFKLLTILVRAEVIRGRLRIGCEIERWSTSVLPTNMPLRESSKRISFDLGTDGQSLLRDGEELTAYEAADVLLTTAFLKKKG